MPHICVLDHAGLGLKSVDPKWAPREQGEINPAWDEWFDKVKVQLKDRERMYPPAEKICSCGAEPDEEIGDKVGSIEVHYQAVLESIMLTGMDASKLTSPEEQGEEKSLIADSECVCPPGWSPLPSGDSNRTALTRFCNRRCNVKDQVLDTMCGFNDTPISDVTYTVEWKVGKQRKGFMDNVDGNEMNRIENCSTWGSERWTTRDIRIRWRKHSREQMQSWADELYNSPDSRFALTFRTKGEKIALVPDGYKEGEIPRRAPASSGVSSPGRAPSGNLLNGPSFAKVVDAGEMGFRIVLYVYVSNTKTTSTVSTR